MSSSSEFLAAPEVVIETVESIYNSFMKKNALFEVNISSQYQQVTQNVQNLRRLSLISSEIVSCAFDVAQKEALRVIAHDCFVRFRQDQKYLSKITEMQKLGAKTNWHTSQN